MNFNLSWLNSRKRLLNSSAIDLVILYACFYTGFNKFISNKFLLFLICFLISILWIISSYIVGRYAKLSKNKLILFLHQFYKTFINILINLLISQLIFRIFWNWEYINFSSFTSFTNTYSMFYLKVFFVSMFFQFLLSVYLSKRYVNPSLFYFFGKKSIKNYLEKLLKNKPLLNLKAIKSLSALDNSEVEGIIIEDDKDFNQEDIELIFKMNRRGIKLIKISKWCEEYLQRYPSGLVKFSEVLEGVFKYDENTLKARIKRIGEFLLCLLLLIFTTPILIVSALLIKLEDGGPIFYSQIRNGFGGNTFKIIKLRTMITNAESDGIQWSKSRDLRITKIGRILRKLRLDELPQLVLVLSGEMSLIGPRPERPYIDNFLKKEIPNYDLRYLIKPGISGWAQVNYPYGASIEDSEYKLSYDLYYIKNFSIFLDCLILLKTMRLVFNGKGSKPIEN